MVRCMVKLVIQYVCGCTMLYILRFHINHLTRNRLMGFLFLAFFFIFFCFFFLLFVYFPFNFIPLNICDVCVCVFLCVHFLAVLSARHHRSSVCAFINFLRRKIEKRENAGRCNICLLAYNVQRSIRSVTRFSRISSVYSCLIYKS